MKKINLKFNKDNILPITLIGVLVFIFIMVIFTGVTYAYWQKNYVQKEANKIKSGCFSFELTDENSISLANTYPMSETDAMKSKPYNFTITNNCSIDMYYNVTLNTTGSSDLDNYLNYKLVDEKGNTVGPKIIGSTKKYDEYNNYTYTDENNNTYDILNSYILTSGSLTKATMNSDNSAVVTKGQSKTYKLYVWMDESVEDLSTMGKSFTGKVIVTSSTDSSVKGIVCKRATTLHTEECTQTDPSHFCSGAGYTTTGSKGTTTITYGNLGTAGTLASGDAYDCDVNGDGIFDSETERFYYVSDYYDTDDFNFKDDTAVLLYYNFVGNGAYDSAANLFAGPKTAVELLPTIEMWQNVSLKKSIRNILDEGNKKLTTFSYAGKSARLLTIQELKKYIPKYNDYMGVAQTANYFFENTYFAKSIGVDAWFLENYIIGVNHMLEIWTKVGRVSNGGVTRIEGIRPVIEVPKVNMEI